jgi:hypothetical protein
MFYKEVKRYFKYYDALLISIILSVLVTPSLWYMWGGDFSLVILSTIIWAGGIFLVFQPTLKYLFPYMITKVGIIGLIFIASIISFFLNSFFLSILLPLLPSENVDLVVNTAIFSSFLNNIFLFIWFYVLIAESVLLNLDFSRIQSLFSKSILEYFIEVLFIFILPILFLFWSDITYSFRLFLGVISIGTGLFLFLQRVEIDSVVEKVMVASVYLALILIINVTVINSFGIDKIPAKSVKARIDGNNILLNTEASNIESPMFELSSDPFNSRTVVYKVLASIPLLGLNIGYRVATLPKVNFVIKGNNAQYTVYDQYNNRELLKLVR